MKKIVFFTLFTCISLIGKSQGFIQTGVGLNTGLQVALNVDAGYILPTRKDYGGPFIAGNATTAFGSGTLAGGSLGYQWYGVSAYAGYGAFMSHNAQYEGKKGHFFGGISFRYPDNICYVDLRWAANAGFVTLGVRLPNISHRK